MPYTPTNYTTLVSAANLNKGEVGIQTAQAEAESASASAALKAAKANLPVNVKDHGATGLGVADETSAFNAARDAAGVGGHIFVPPGTYKLVNFNLLSRQVLEGVGAATVLAAGTGASYIVRMEGLLYGKVSNFFFSGTGVAGVKGLLIASSATASSQGHLIERVWADTCAVGFSVEQGTVAQADKNTYVNCRATDCTVGMRINSVNAQEQVLINTSFDGCPTGIDAVAGSLNMIGGQFQSCATVALIISGANMQQIKWDHVITEGCGRDIDGNTNWVSSNVILDHCVLGPLTNTVRMAIAGSTLVARCTRFNNVPLLVTGTDCCFYEEHCQFLSGGTLNSSGATQFRHQKWDLNGLRIDAGVAAATAFELTNGSMKLGGPNQSAAIAPIKAIVPISQAVDLPSVAANTAVEINIGSAAITLGVGDLFMMAGTPGLPYGLIVEALPVTTANNFRLRVTNVTGAAIDAASLTFRFLVIRLLV